MSAEIYRIVPAAQVILVIKYVPSTGRFVWLLREGGALSVTTGVSHPTVQEAERHARTKLSESVNERMIVEVKW